MAMLLSVLLSIILGQGLGFTFPKLLCSLNKADILGILAFTSILLLVSIAECNFSQKQGLALASNGLLKKRNFFQTLDTLCFCFFWGLITAKATLPCQEIGNLTSAIEKHSQEEDEFAHNGKSRSPRLEITGTVCNPIRRREHLGLEISLCNSSISEDRQREKPLGTFSLRTSAAPWDPGSSLFPGDTTTATLKLNPIITTLPDFLPPSDHKSYLLRQGITARGWVENFTTTPEDREIGWREILLEKLLRENQASDALGVILSMTLGIAQMLSAELKEICKATGTSHMLVVSGYHFSMIYIFTSEFFLFLLSRSRIMLIHNLVIIPSRICALASCLAYSYLIGTNPPIARAAIASVIAVIASIWGRKPHQWRALFFILLLIINIWPGAFFDVGVQLTFSALAGMLLAHRLSHDRLQKIDSSALRSIATTTCFALGAWVATTPVIYLWFGTVAWIGPLANILVVPLLSMLAVGGGGLCLLLIAFGIPGGEALLACVIYLVDLCLELLRIMASGNR